MNERRIQQVIDIEKQAEGILDEATREAARLPVEAAREAEQLIDKARGSATAEAERIVAQARAEVEAADIMAAGHRRISEIETLAKQNFDRAVAYVLDRVIGKE